MNYCLYVYANDLLYCELEPLKMCYMRIAQFQFFPHFLSRVFYVLLSTIALANIYYKTNQLEKQISKNRFFVQICLCGTVKWMII